MHGFKGLMVAGAALAMSMGAGPVSAQVFKGRPDATAGVNLAQQAQILSRLTPVTDAMLRDPPPGDWLTWRRTYDGYGFSPLDQINRANVSGLKVAWAWSLYPGPTGTAPIVHDGVMFVFSYGDKVQALNAANGDLLWEYARDLPKDVRPGLKRNLAIYEDKLIVPTSDGHLLALDVKTGKPVWDEQAVDIKEKFSFSGGPMVVSGKVIQGVTGCGAGQAGGCFITAHDARTGKFAWRFNSIAKPDEPGGNSWAGLPWAQRHGGSVWMSGTYDPGLNLVFMGIGQPYPWPAAVRGTLTAKGKGVTNDLLYTNSTVALNPETGKLVWHYQHLANDNWDMDYAFERTLVDLPVNGKTRRVAVTAGKMAILEWIDAATGKFLHAKDLGVQTMVQSIDPKTGRKTIFPDKIPQLGKMVTICPFPGGARSWPASAYNPMTKVLYLPMQEHCGEMTALSADAGGAYKGGSGVDQLLIPKPGNDGNIGRLEATNLETRQAVWTRRERAPQTTAALPTAGGLVFEGSLDRHFRALDDQTGKVLWDIRLNDAPASFPVSYAVDGKQYVALTVGGGSAYERTWDQLLPDVKNPPAGGAMVWVFELPSGQ